MPKEANMRTRSKLTIWRFTSYLLLITLVFAPVTSFYVRAAPAGQDAGPESPSAPGDHLVTDISLGPDTPNILRFNERANLNFIYSTTEPSGVRIFTRPY